MALRSAELPGDRVYQVGLVVRSALTGLKLQPENLYMALRTLIRALIPLPGMSPLEMPVPRRTTWRWTSMVPPVTCGGMPFVRRSSASISAALGVRVPQQSWFGRPPLIS